MRRLMIVVLLIAMGSIGIAVLRRSGPTEPHILPREKSSAVVLGWKDAHRVTIHLDGASLETALAELQRQGGVPVSSFHKKEVVSLHFDDVPFWEAIARTSMHSGLPFRTNFGHDEV